MALLIFETKDGAQESHDKLFIQRDLAARGSRTHPSQFFIEALRPAQAGW